MHDRGMIKWLPFNSIINGELVVNSIEKEKSKIVKPTLSEEQIQNIENAILESMINEIPLTFKIYKGGFINEISGMVVNIDSVKQKIYLDNHKYLYFREIVNVLKSNLGYNINLRR